MLRTYGGYGYSRILDTEIPFMKRVGITDEQIKRITVDNPKEIFTIIR